MYNLYSLRKLLAFTFCLLITQLTFAKSPYWVKNSKAGADLKKTSVKAVPTAPPTGVSVSSTSICNGSSVSLTATCSTGTVTWYTQATGGTSIGSGSPLSKSPTTSTTYYASCLVSGGPARIAAGSESTRVSAGTVTVTSIPSDPTNVSVNQTNICQGDSVTLNANCNSGTVTWYREANFIGTGTGLRQSPTEEFTRYFAKCINGSCQSNFEAADGVYVNPRPDFPTDVSVNQASICAGSSVSLTANCSAGTVTWYT